MAAARRRRRSRAARDCAARPHRGQPAASDSRAPASGAACAVRHLNMRSMRVDVATAMLAMGLAGCDAFLPPLTEDDRDVSIARIWNEVLLEGIRNDYARPTVHARNLWHSSAAMYDAWAAYDDTASTWLLGKTQAGYDCGFTPPRLPRDRQAAREQAVSFAAYRIVRHRFRNSPGAEVVAELADRTMAELGFD